MILILAALLVIMVVATQAPKLMETTDGDATCWDPRLDQLHVLVDRSGVDTSRTWWRVAHAWLTVNGSWESAPACAKRWQRDTLGGDHHIYAAVDLGAGLHCGAQLAFGWPGETVYRLTEADCWANIPIQAGYDWSKGPGPYWAGRWDNSERLVGMGLPYPPLPWQMGVGPEGGVHVSYFVILERMAPATPTPTPTYALTPTPTPMAPVWEPYDLKVCAGCPAMRVWLRKR